MKPTNYPYSISNREVAQLGSALASGARGHGFESHLPDQDTIMIMLGIIIFYLYSEVI